MIQTEEQAIFDLISVYEKSKFLTEEILDNVPFLLFIVDLKGNIYRINKETANLLQVSMEKVAGLNLSHFFNKEKVQQIFWNLNQIQNGSDSKKQLEIEYCNETISKNKLILLEIKKLHLQTAAHHLFSLTGSEITEYREQVKKRIHLEDQLKFEKIKSRRFSILASFNEISLTDGFSEGFEKVMTSCLEGMKNTTTRYYAFNAASKALISERTLFVRSALQELNHQAIGIQENQLQISVDDKVNPVSEVFVSKNSKWIVTENPQFPENFKTSILIFISFKNLSLGVLEISSTEFLENDTNFFDILIEVGSKLGSFIYQLELKKEISEKNIQLENTSKLAALGEFSGSLAHEINNPLTIIYGKLRHITNIVNSDRDDKPQIRLQIEGIIKTLDRITAIIRGLRIFSRDSSRDTFTSINVNEIINNTKALCEERFNSSNIELKLPTPSPDLMFIGNEAQIVQVLMNLLNNSIDAVQSLPERWVRIDVTEDDSSLKFEVTDSGLGIPESVSHKIMQPFFTTKELGKGTGLGLSISFGIIKAHNGELYLNNKCKNTQFVIKLSKFKKS
jgi:signal transduction histidine kinase